jgi:hypothetical protein
MLSQNVKFITGFGAFGGSTIALVEHCKLLSENGFNVSLYAPGQWHLGRFSGSRDISEFASERDDILVFHHVDLDVRPKCRKSILYLHEKSLWPLKGRNLLPFDSLAYVSEDQRSFHGLAGPIIPNPVGRMVNPLMHHPPGANVAGIVGTIQERKRQHLSIKKALEDGRSKVLLFGDFEPSYFKSYIEPILSDKVLYMGLVEPEDRMRIYNSFDCLYMFSSDESASLTLGECRLLDKEVVKSHEVRDYDIVGDDEVLERWRSLFFDRSPVMGEFAVTPSVPCGRLVCVVTHNRKEIVGRWLRAWNSAEKFGAKLAVFHACDGDAPDPDEMNNILAYGPDFYIPFKNGSLRDMLALHMALRDGAGLPEWDSIFWFTDDMMPMRRDFLAPFVNKLKGNVGLVAQCYEPRHEHYREEPGFGCLPHIRTVAYALSREASDILVFPAVGEERDRPYLFEHGRIGVYEDHILKQVTSAGYDFELCHSEKDRYVHWTASLDWMWDAHLFASGAVVSGRSLSSHEMWALYESQFSRPGSFDPLVIFTPERCEEVFLKKGKVSAIIPTFSSPMRCFMCSVLSLLMRSDPTVLEHVFVSINGPDSREGGDELQDRKQSFVEDLRSCDWSGMRGFNPGLITMTRTWSRIGHAQALEQSIPWVDTEFYLSMHDDVVVMSPSWCLLDDFMDNDSMIMKTWGNHVMGALRATGRHLDMPHLNTIFTMCRKPLMTRMSAGWTGFVTNGSFKISDYMDPIRLVHDHKKIHLGASDSVLDDREYSSAGLDIGCFLLSKICLSGLDVGRFDADTVRHFESASWRPGRFSQTKEIEDLERQISSIPQYSEIYERYLED